MRIAFDLDDTLIPAGRETFPTEDPPSWLGRRLAPERLRAGSAALLRGLAQRGCDLWIYTTSLRSPFHIRLLFLSYGIWIQGVVNEERHRRWLQSQGGRFACSKYPPAFGIEILIDDSEGVREEGQHYHFRVIRVAPEDINWTQKILEVVNRSLVHPLGLPTPPL